MYETGYVYHIKNEYFAKANDPNLMENKEGASKRPTYYCIKDEKTDIMWVIPMSSKFEKYRAIHDSQIKKRGECLGIEFGVDDWKQSVFLLQNMFPITMEYIDHIHTIGKDVRPVEHELQGRILRKFNRIRFFQSKGRKMTFTDVDRLEKLMLDELETYNG